MEATVEEYVKIREIVAREIEYYPDEDILPRIRTLTTNSYLINYYSAQQKRINYEPDTAKREIEEIDLNSIPSFLVFPIHVEILYITWLSSRNTDLQPIIEKCNTIYESLDQYLQSVFIEEYATLLNVIGNSHWVSGKLLLALPLYLKSLRMRETLDRPISLATSFHNLGLLYLNFGDPIKAREEMKRSIERFSKIGIPNALSLTMHTMGEISFALGELKDAKNYYGLCLSMREQLSDSFGIVNVYSDLVKVELSLHDMEMAETHLSKMKTVIDQTPDPRKKALYDFTKALVFKSKSRMKYRAAAEELFKVSIRSEHLDYEKKVLAMKNLADIYADELLAYGEEDTFIELNQLVSEMVTIAKDNAMYAVYIESLILKSKLFLVNEEYDRTIDELEYAKNEAIKLGLERFIKIVNQEKATMMNRIEEMQSNIGKHRDLIENIKSTELGDYLKSILHIIENNRS